MTGGYYCPHLKYKKISTETRTEVRGGRAGDFRIPTVKYYRCNEWGHKSNTCPRRAEVHLLDDKGKEIIEQKEDDFDEQYDEEDPPDEGQRLTYLIHRSFYIPHGENVTERENLSGRGTINGKLCDIIIDNGSTDNLISLKAVQQLGLKVEKYLTLIVSHGYKVEIKFLWTYVAKYLYPLAEDIKVKSCVMWSRWMLPMCCYAGFGNLMFMLITMEGQTTTSSR